MRGMTPRGLLFALPRAGGGARRAVQGGESAPGAGVRAAGVRAGWRGATGRERRRPARRSCCGRKRCSAAVGVIAWLAAQLRVHHPWRGCSLPDHERKKKERKASLAVAIDDVAFDNDCSSGLGPAAAPCMAALHGGRAAGGTEEACGRAVPEEAAGTGAGTQLRPTHPNERACLRAAEVRAEGTAAAHGLLESCQKKSLATWMWLLNKFRSNERTITSQLTSLSGV